MNRFRTNAASILLALAGTLTTPAQEAFHWETNNGTITITSYRLGEPLVVVPEIITGLPVTTIGSQAFYRNNNVLEVSLPATITNIGYCAFQYCGALARINFPPNLEHIDSSAFDATGLEVVVLPASLRTMGETPFFQCSKLQAINVEISNVSFSSLNGILFNKDQSKLIEYPAGRAGEYAVPASVTEISDRAFQNAQGLTKVSIPGNTKWVGYYVFNGCAQLAEATLDEGITHLGDQSFGDCRSLRSIRLPTTLQSLGTYCFSGCTNLSQVTLPEGLTTLGGQWAFNGCTGLTNVAIPGTIENARYGTFSGCTNLQSVTIHEGVKKLEATFQDCKRLTSVSLPESLINIGDNAFNGCTSLSTLAIPNGVTNIGWYTFANCAALQSPLLPTGLEHIGRGAFQACQTIEAITLPGKVQDIGDICFENCAKLRAISIPTNTAIIGTRALYNCPSLQMVHVEEGNPGYSSLDGVLFNGDRTVLLQYPTARVGSYTVPPTVRRIDYDAFTSALGLTGLTLPPGLEMIRDNAFSGCTGLTTVRIPATVTEIGNYAFAYCTNLLGILFDGNAPSMSWAIVYQSPEAGIYYSPGTSGWDPPPAGIALTVWNGNLKTEPGSYGFTAEGFKITASGNTNIPVAFQASTNLSQPNWSTLITLRLTNGTFSVFDSASAGVKERYYRVAWP